MNIWLISAGLVSIASCGIHVVLGGKEIHHPMLATDLHRAVKSVWTVVWHFVTALLFLNGVWLFIAASTPDTALAFASLPIASSLATAALFLFYGLRRLGNVWENPQWVLFLLIAGLASIGLAA